MPISGRCHSPPFQTNYRKFGLIWIAKIIPGEDGDKTQFICAIKSKIGQKCLRQKKQISMYIYSLWYLSTEGKIIKGYNYFIPIIN